MQVQSPTQKAGSHASLIELSSSDNDDSPPANPKKDAERLSPTQDSEDDGEAGAGACNQHNLFMRCRLLPA